MKRGTRSSVWLAVLALSLLGSTMFAVTILAVEKDPLESRVPADELAGAKAKKNPIPATADNIAKGKELYEGKALCVTCHGASGKGDGDAGKALDPTPRDFTNAKFHAAKTPGEMMWVITNGSAGTGMISYVPNIITEEEAWTIINYERSFKGK